MRVNEDKPNISKADASGNIGVEIRIGITATPNL